MQIGLEFQVSTNQDLLPHQFECPTNQTTHEHMMLPDHKIYL